MLQREGLGPKQLDRKYANKITGGFSKTSKTGYSYGLPNWSCKTGQQLAKNPNSTCAKCYASRGKYGTCNVRWVQARRLASLKHPRWVEAMHFLLSQKEERGMDHFRWHDSGDMRSMPHFQAIIDLAEAHPEMIFWLPTKEYKLVAAMRGKPLPPNLTLRVSAPMVNGAPPRGVAASTVHSTDSVARVFRNPMGACQKPEDAAAAQACENLRPLLKDNPGARAHICPIAGQRLRPHSKTNPEGNQQPPGRNLPEIKSCKSMGCDVCWQRKVPWVSYKAH
jgi:hypothetical protein